MDGFKEYELNMQSIQTILSNTKADGTNLGTVNAALDELNEYSDKTIYNFGQMTRNIGTFTAAGVDLDTSVQSIKGISNLAAISGSSADQAASAMYQLSQAVSTGTLRLIDWNSVVNAGMGGEVFQKALFETGKTLGTITDVPIDKTFEEWTSGGNSFRASLEDNWLTSEVLTTTLQGFTGEMTEAQLLAIGYTKEQSAQIMELGKTGVEAATKVRTLTQLFNTAKESIGSGWSESFRIVLGNFEEATELFSGISGTLGEAIAKSADARNKLLQGWKDLGGRTLLIDSLKEAFKNLGEILRPIKEAFREIFPPMTAERLFALTESFSKFTAALKPSAATIDSVKRIFKGLFSILDIGWEIIKQGVTFIGELIDSVTNVGSGAFLDFFANLGDFFTELNDALVEGGGIAAFFQSLGEFIREPIPFIQELKEKITDFFTGFDPALPDQIGSGFGRIGQRFEGLQKVFEKAKDIWAPFQTAIKKVIEVLDEVWTYISTWFSELGQKIAAVMGPGDFDAAVDAINVGLLGGIAALLAKFIKDGFSFDIGSGFFEKIGDSFEQLTGVLSAMQTSIKADALLKIAGAIALLTASVLTLSLIDSAALTKSLTAMAVGFGQLMASFAILTKMSAGPKGAASLVVLSTGLVIISGAILVLAGAMKILASMDAEELSKGLGTVTAMLGVMTGVAILLSKNSKSLIGAGIAMSGIAFSLIILAGAVKLFAMMDWPELGKGFAAVAGGLLIIAGAMRLMPGNMILQGAGLLMVATSMSILAGAVKLFSLMSWEDIGKGMAGIAGGLVIIGLAMKLMPLTLPITAAGLILVGIALNEIAASMLIFGSMDWDDIGRGLVAMGGALLVLAIATNAMSGAIVGAVAIGIVSVALLVLAEVLQQFAKISFDDLLRGLIGIAAALAVLGIAAMLLQPALGPMMLLGAALVLIGGGFALFGLGASLVAEAFERLAKAGEAGSKALLTSLKALGKAIPAIMTGLAEGVLEFIKVFTDAAPVIAKALGVLLAHLLDTLVELIPKAGEVIGTLLTTILELIREYIPDLALLGIDLLLSLLEGIRERIDDVVIVVSEIIQEFLNALAEELPKIVDSVANLITEFFTSVAEAVGKVSGTLMFGIGIAFIDGFMDGIDDAVPKGPQKWFTDLAKTVIGWIGNVAKTLWQKGVDFINGLLKGITEKAVAVTTWFTQLAGKILGWIGATLNTLKQKGIDLISGLYNGLVDRIGVVSSFLGGIASSAASWVGNTLSSLWQKGRDLIQGLFDGLKSLWESVKMWAGSIGSNLGIAMGGVLSSLWQKGRDILQGLWNGMKSLWESIKSWWEEKIEWIKNLPGVSLILGSPSKYMYWVGEMIVAGLANAIRKDETVIRSMNDLMDNAKSTFENSLAVITDSLGDMNEFNPVIAPVLDLTSVESEAKKIADYIQTGQILVPTLSIASANVIATSTKPFEDDSPIKPPAGSGEVKFEQNIYAPAQLSTGDIYRQTRNQITMAKEELSIP